MNTPLLPSLSPFLSRVTWLLVMALLLPVTAQAGPESTADASMLRGTQAFQRGAFGEALTQWKQAVNHYKGTGNRPMHIEANPNRHSSLWNSPWLWRTRAVRPSRKPRCLGSSVEPT
jgi:hypothetical protein